MYDILNCGPRHRFVANGKLVHNSDSINLQNLPSRGPSAGKIKAALEAPKDHVVLDCDSSQIEARMVAWLAGQTDLVEAFDRGEDVYKIMASAIYNKPVEDIDGHERFIGKFTILGAGYGMGAARFREQLASTGGVHITEAEAKHIINTYRSRYPAIPILWRQAGRGIAALARGKFFAIGPNNLIKFNPHKEGVVLPNNMVIHYPGLARIVDEFGNDQYEYKSRYGMTKIYGAKCVENISQALARIAVAEQMLLINKLYPVALTVHDSVVNVVHESKALQAAKYMVQCMRTRPEWAPDLPLTCEISIGRDYGKMKELDL